MPTLDWSGKCMPPHVVQPIHSFEQWGTGDTEKIQLHCGNNLSWLHHAQTKSKRFDLIYLDPPFCSQANYHQQINIDGQTHTIPGFTDVLSVDAYLQFIYERLHPLKDLLSDTGSLFLHCDYQQSHTIRCLLDEVFGPKQFRNEIIWHYTGGGRAKKYFSRKHDSIFWYSKGTSWTFNTESIRIPYKATSGFAKGGITSKSGKKYLPNPKGTLPDDTWDIPMLNPLAKERTGYPTQKPMTLLERIVLACSNAGDSVLDPFMGSGTTGMAAIKHDRRFVGLDANWNSVHLMRKRLWAQNASFSITHSTPLKSPISEIKLIYTNQPSTKEWTKEWTVAFTNQHTDSTPIQMVYSQYADGTWHQTIDPIHSRLIRVVALNGEISDFEIPSTNGPFKDGMILYSTV